VPNLYIAGTKLSDLENAARDYGWELRCMPLTYKMTTIAGLFSGGFGAINYGPIATSANILALKVMTAEKI